MIPDFSKFEYLIKDLEVLTNTRRPEITKVKIRFELVDGSFLFLSEVMIHESGWFEYGYHWTDSSRNLKIRWDNAPHHPHISSFPFHKHVGSDDNIQSSEPMSLEKVFEIIKSRM